MLREFSESFKLPARHREVHGKTQKRLHFSIQDKNGDIPHGIEESDIDVQHSAQISPYQGHQLEGGSLAVEDGPP